MKRIIILGILLLSFAIEFYGEEFKGKNFLLVYEETNASIDPWRNLFAEELKQENIDFEEISASNVMGKDLSKYDTIIIYGAVMAFTMKGPIRDWLKSETNLEGKKVGLFVTANRWFLEKYYNQLKELLTKKGANIVDAVSSTTHKLSKEEKQKLVRQHIQKMK